jgi:hypothetical protein
LPTAYGMCTRAMATRIGGAAALTAAVMLATTAPAAAEFRVRPAAVEEGEIAVESNDSYAIARAPRLQEEQSYTTEIEWAPLSWWLVELEGEGGRNPGPDQPTRVTALTGENLFQLVEPGEYWADLGFFAEYSRTLSHHAADAITAGPTVSKVLGRSVNTLNLFVSKEVAGHAAGRAQLTLAWQTRLTLDKPYLEPGFEIYSAPGALNRFLPFAQQDLRFGPVLYGTIRTFGASKFKYEVGYLFGLTPGTPDGTVKWRLEYEFRF